MINIGYGYGIKSGIKHSSGKIISWTHADLQFDINDVIKFFKNKDEFNSSKIMLKVLEKIDLQLIFLQMECQ